MFILPVLYQLIKPPEPKSEPNRLNYKLKSSSTTKQIDVGLFNLGGFHLADEDMPDKADRPEVLRVLDVLLRRLSDGERLLLALVKLVRQCAARCFYVSRGVRIRLLLLEMGFACRGHFRG